LFIVTIILTIKDNRIQVYNSYRNTERILDILDW